MNQLEKTLENPAERSKTFKELVHTENELRERLAGEMPDDEVFSEKALLVSQYMNKVSSGHLDGEERARMLYVARKLFKEVLEGTQRGLNSSEFCLTEKARSSAQEEIGDIKKSL